MPLAEVDILLQNPLWGLAVKVHFANRLTRLIMSLTQLSSRQTGLFRGQNRNSDGGAACPWKVLSEQ